MKPYLLCPTCESDDIMKNGTTRRGKQNYKCGDWGRQFVENPQWQPKGQDTVALIDRLMLERIALAGIARVLQLSESWLQQDVNGCYEEVAQQAEVIPKTSSRLVVQVDKDSGLTSYIERLNNPLRQRISRLVRLNLSFSKKLDNHIGAIWNFIHHYNQKLREKLQREQTVPFSSSFT
jgi:transposase-like protein